MGCNQSRKNYEYLGMNIVNYYENEKYREPLKCGCFEDIQPRYLLFFRNKDTDLVYVLPFNFKNQSRIVTKDLVIHEEHIDNELIEKMLLECSRCVFDHYHHPCWDFKYVNPKSTCQYHNSIIETRMFSPQKILSENREDDKSKLIQ